jgi:superfamily I DNA/RNA helicase
MEFTHSVPYLSNLNFEQFSIATNNEFIKSKYSMCIIACAGSGKTTTIISKIIYMIKDLGCKPEHFFITTFTRNAASELKNRLSEYLTENQIGLMTIGTFHSIAYQYVNKIKKASKINDLVEDVIEKFNVEGGHGVLHHHLDVDKTIQAVTEWCR